MLRSFIWWRWEKPDTAPRHEKHFRHNSLFVGGSTRKAVAEGRGDFTPLLFSEIPKLFKNGSLPVDAALIQTAPPDENGNLASASP